MKNFTLFQKWLVCGFLLAACLPPAISQWSVETMPNQHIQFSAVALGNRVVFGPGSSGAGFHTHVDVYNLEYNGWEETTDVSAPRANAAGVAANGKVYFAGGLANSWLAPVMLDVVDILDVESGEWTTAQLSEARSELKAVHVGNKLLFAGGISGLSGDFSTLPTEISTSAVVDIYDLDSGQWSTASLSEARVGIAAAVWGNIAVFAGGQTASGQVTNSVDIYDAATGLWSTLELSETKGWCEAAALAGKIYIAGGVTGDLQVTDKVEILDLATMTWDSAQLSQARGGMRSGVMGFKIFFAGGGKYNLTKYIWTTPFSNKVDIYDAETGEWSVDNLQAGLINHAAVVAGNQFFVAGGAASPFNRVEIFTDETFTPASERLAEVEVSLSPNPATDATTLLIQANSEELFQVEILDLNGRLIRTFEMNGGTTAGVDVADLSAGSYFVKVFNDNKMTAKRLAKI